MAKITDNKPDMPLGKQNYILMLVGLGMIIMGFLLLAGGASKDPDAFNYEMFNARRIVVAPLMLLAGFSLQIYAIIKRPKKTGE